MTSGEIESVDTPSVLQRLRVAVCSHMPKDKSYSGGRYHAFMMAEALALGGHDVYFITNNEPVFCQDFAGLPAHDQIRLCLTPDFQKGLPEGSFDIVVFVPAYEMRKEYYYGVQAFAIDRNAHLVFVNYESGNWFNALAPVPRDLALWEPWLKVARRSSLILSISRESDWWARQFYPPVPGHTRFDWCYPAINTVAANRVRALPKEKRILLFTRFAWSEHKGTAQLEELFCPAMRGFTLVLIVGAGEVPSKALDALAARAEQHGVALEILYRLNDEEKFREIQRAALMLFPSFFEGFGYPPIEAQYCNTPVVAFDLPVLRETSGDRLIYVPPGDWAQFRQRIEETLTSGRSWDHLRDAVVPIASLEAMRDRLNTVLAPMARETTRRIQAGADVCAVYITAESGYLATRWIRNRRGNREIVLVVGKAALPEAIDVQAECSHAKEIVVLPDASAGVETGENHHLSRLKALSSKEMVVPVPIKSSELRFLPPNTMPDIRAIYGDFRRLWLAGCRRLTLSSLHGESSFEVPFLLDDFQGRHRGRRCFVIGNGPSLNDIDMTKLKSEITFGANRCYLGYEKWGFAFTYWGITDRLQIEEYGFEYEDNIPPETIKFFPFEYLPLFHVKNGCPINYNYEAKPPKNFSDSPEVIHLGNTVTHMEIQLAVIMGCNPIILIGVDHRYNLQSEAKVEDAPKAVCKETSAEHPPSATPPAPQPGLRRRSVNWFRKTAAYRVLRQYAPAGAKRLIRRAMVPMDEETPAASAVASTSPAPANPAEAKRASKKKDLWVAADASKPTHFTSAYTSGSKKFVVPRPERAEASFDAAARWAEAHGIQILNATPGTALKSFPLINYEDLF